jgi:acyl carrier protein
VQGAEALELEIKTLIVEAMMLEDIAPSEIDSEAPLFVEGLGLDSIDALELAMALEERFGVPIQDDPERNREIFASVRSLADFVRTQGAAPGGGRD